MASAISLYISNDFLFHFVKGSTLGLVCGQQLLQVRWDFYRCDLRNFMVIGQISMCSCRNKQKVPESVLLCFRKCDSMFAEGLFTELKSSERSIKPSYNFIPSCKHVYTVA